MKYFFEFKKLFAQVRGGRFCAKRNSPTKFSCLTCSKGSEGVYSYGGEWESLVYPTKSPKILIKNAFGCIFHFFFAIFSPKLPETNQILCTKIQEQNRTNIKHGQRGISRNIYVYLTNCHDIKEGSWHFQTPVGGTTVFHHKFVFWWAKQNHSFVD